MRSDHDHGHDHDHSRVRAYRFGLRAETACVWWLRARGYRVLARRFKTTVGEIDIIARRGSLLAMIEVKARRGGDISQAVPTARQRQRIARAAEAFLARSPRLAGCDIRFDLMVARPWRLPRHLRDAWRP
jgi:putative endonuclease